MASATPNREEVRDLSQTQFKSARWTFVGTTSLLLALVQSLCTAVFAISGVRLLIGLSALAAISGVYTPARGFHQDAIRIPMLAIASLGAILNLTVLGWMRHLRNQPSARWRRREMTAKERRSNRLQIVFAFLTLLMVALEVWTHSRVHRTAAAPAHASAMIRPTPFVSQLVE